MQYFVSSLTRFFSTFLFISYWFGNSEGGDSGNDMITQEDTIFVSGMSPETNEDEIANHFGAIGIIKVSANHLTYYCFTAFVLLPRLSPYAENYFQYGEVNASTTHTNPVLFSSAANLER